MEAQVARQIFLICPVRNSSPEIERKIRAYVQRLEYDGAEVYWPFRDTDQNDLTGIRICADNAEAILEADEVHVWYSLGSQGSVFDLGMVFMLKRMGFRKKVVIANPNEIPETHGKSFENVLLALAEGDKEAGD